MDLGPEWTRLNDDSEEVHARWRHSDGTEAKIERYSDGTWDAIGDSDLLENFDTVREAFERLKEFAEE